MLSQTEWALLNPDPLQAGVVEIFASTNPIMQYMPWANIAGAAYVYNREQTLPGVAFRGINESFTESTGVITQLADPLKIIGGDLDVDTALIAWSAGPNDTRAIHDAMKVKALSLSHLKTVFDGDATANPKEFDGLNTRLTGAQVISAGTNGGVLTLTMLDDLIDAIAGEASLLLMNKKTRQVIRQLARSVNALTIAKDDLGREIDLYYGVPFGIVEDDHEGNAILGFDESQGTANDTASIYAVKFGPGAMFGAQTAPISVRDLGELQSKPAYRTRVEHYGTLVLEHPKCAARLKGVKLAYVSLAEADAIASARLFAEAWGNARARQKEQALITATALLDRMQWQGRKLAPTQPLAWPRVADRAPLGYPLATEIPDDIKIASIELALHLLATGFLSGTPPIMQQMLGDAMVMYYPHIADELPKHVRRLIEPYLRVSSANVAEVRF